MLRRSRPGSRAGAGLVVLLAALVHLLACAHGPAATTAVRVDAILTVSTTCGQASEPTDDPAAQRTTPAEDPQEQCWGTDEPTLQPPRDIAPAAPALHNTLPPGGQADAPIITVRAAPPPDPRPDSASTGQSRARLGVWRT